MVTSGVMPLVEIIFNTGEADLERRCHLYLALPEAPHQYPPYAAGLQEHRQVLSIY
jgi:hypothetical protein